MLCINLLSGQLVGLDLAINQSQLRTAIVKFENIPTVQHPVGCLHSRLVAVTRLNCFAVAKHVQHSSER